MSVRVMGRDVLADYGQEGGQRVSYQLWTGSVRVYGQGKGGRGQDTSYG